MNTLDSVFARKNFPNILQLLYQEKTIRQKDVVETLGISKGAVCLNMNELDALGFVQQQKEGRCKTYRLLEKGAQYYEANFLPSPPPEPALPGEAANQLSDTLADMIAQLTRSLAEVEALAKVLRAQKGEEPLSPVRQGRHFDTILRLLYENKIMKKADLAACLGITPGNTFHHVKRMIEAGYVEEGRDNISRTYRLTPAGERYYRQSAGLPDKTPEPSPPPVHAPEPPKPATVLNEDHFQNIIRLLYQTGDISLSELCTRLNRSHGNVYRDMQNLILEGFVKKKMVKHCNYYTLSDQGRDSYERLFSDDTA